MLYGMITVDPLTLFNICNLNLYAVYEFSCSLKGFITLIQNCEIVNLMGRFCLKKWNCTLDELNEYKIELKSEFQQFDSFFIIIIMIENCSFGNCTEKPFFFIYFTIFFPEIYQMRRLHGNN